MRVQVWTRPRRPLAIDLYCGLGGWTEGLLAEGWDVVGFDIERHVYGDLRYPAQLVLQDCRTLDGRQFKDAALIVASPPCQAFSHMAMPFSIGKQRAAAIRADATGESLRRLTELFDTAFRLQREACAAAGRHIPMVVENVRGAQSWVGRARHHYGSYYLWGDVPPGAPVAPRVAKVGGLDCSKHGEADYRTSGAGGCFRDSAIKNTGGSWFSQGNGALVCRADPRDDHRLTAHLTNPAEHIKCGGDWFGPGEDSSAMRHMSSKSSKRKMASAMIAKIPMTLSRYVARFYKPVR